jgi:hypothetical protein
MLHPEGGFMSKLNPFQWRPQSKVVMGGISGAFLAPIIIAVAAAAGYQMDPELAAAIGSAIAGLLTYWIPNLNKGG